MKKKKKETVSRGEERYPGMGLPSRVSVKGRKAVTWKKGTARPFFPNSSASARIRLADGPMLTDAVGCRVWNPSLALEEIPGWPPEVRERMVAVKKANPEYGPRRIADVLKRFFLIPTSPSTVHKTLSEKGLVNKAKRKPEKNPPKPRFFERSRPNQLWQSDIMTFRLAGRNAYLIGFMDDYSRYIVLPGTVSQPDGGTRAGDLPSWCCRVRGSQRDAHRQRPPVHELAG